MKKKTLTQKRLKELLIYDEETGDFTWKRRRIEEFSNGKKHSATHIMNIWNTKYANTIAGCTSKSHGYIVIKVDSGKLYLAHRLVWLYVYGYFPENEIDHINRIRADNRLGNLREVSHSCNMKNKGKISSNTSGITGVYFNKESGKWMSYIKISGKKIYLGYYTNLKDAAQARIDAEVLYNFPDCNSTKSSAYKYLLVNGW